MTSLEWAVTVSTGITMGCGATGASRAFARRMGIVNHPNPIVAQHTQPVAYLGGVGLAIGLTFAVAAGLLAGVHSLPMQMGRGGWSVLTGGVIFLAIGVIDDLIALSPPNKLLLQTVGSLVVVLQAGIQLVYPLSYISVLLGVLWVVLMVNAVNVVDVCDGLVGGLTIVAALVFAALNPASMLLPIALASAAGGFLIFNKPSASIFLGDAGAHLIGFLLAAFSMEVLADDALSGRGVAVVLVNGVFFFEVVFLVAMRTRQRIPWWRGSPDHFALRLQRRGFSRWHVDIAACLAATVLGVLAVVSARNVVLASLSAGVALVAAIGAWKYLVSIDTIRTETASPSR